MVVIVKSGCIRESCCIRARVVVSAQSGCIQAKWLYLGKSGCIRAKVAVYLQSGFNVANGLY